MNKSYLFLGSLLCGMLIWASGLSPVAAEEGMAWRELPITQRVMLVDLRQSMSEQTIRLKPGECVQVELPFSAGTGYQWEMSEGPVQLVLAHEAIASVSVEPGITGGPMRHTFILKVPTTMTGSESVCFLLRRPWEDLKQSASSFRLTVTMDRQ